MASQQDKLTSQCARESPRPRWSASSPLPFFLGGLGAIFAVKTAFWLNLPLPQCWLRKFTGVPCPSCGSTRSLAAWASLDLAQALRFNPLFFLLCVAIVLWMGVWLAERFFRRTWLAALRDRLGRWPLWKIAAALLALNWLYLCLALPK